MTRTEWLAHTAVTAGVLILAAVCGRLIPTRATAAVQHAADSQRPSLAVVYYWKAKPGKEAEYSKYIQEVAEPIDAEAQRRGAFLKVTTYVSSKSESPWTHMRVFEVRDQAQAAALGQALDAATARAHPSAEEREKMKQYGAGLRDPAGQDTLAVLP